MLLSTPTPPWYYTVESNMAQQIYNNDDRMYLAENYPFFTSHPSTASSSAVVAVVVVVVSTIAARNCYAATTQWVANLKLHTEFIE